MDGIPAPPVLAAGATTAEKAKATPAWTAEWDPQALAKLHPNSFIRQEKGNLGRATREGCTRAPAAMYVQTGLLLH